MAIVRSEMSIAEGKSWYGKDAFVKIATVYSSDSDRTIEDLSRIYENVSDLRKLVRSLISDYSTENNFCGKKVLLKPNWVKHNSSETDSSCLCTNPNIILAILEEILVYKPKRVTIGDAPIQGCDWDRLLPNQFYERVADLAKLCDVEILIKDFRRVVFNPGNNELTTDRKEIDEFIIFDLGKDSFLEAITVPNRNNFRVSQYNPDGFLETHKPGTHKYCITRELFEADVVISIPKVKTHQKVGLTGALKNIVGLNGDKDYLPHHRLGGTKMGGDAYPGKNIIRYWAELCYDQGNRYRGQLRYRMWSRLGRLLWLLSFPPKEGEYGGAWYGNDTTWRMVMDLNRIVIHGVVDGTIAKTPQRILYSICDGIVGGQGNGPLHPQPLNLGILSFTNNAALNDVCLASIMDLKYEKINLLSSAYKSLGNMNCTIHMNDSIATLNELRDYRIHATMPPGWENYESPK